LSRRRRRLPRTADGCRAVRFDVCLVDHLHVCRFAPTRDDLCKTDGDDDFRSSNGSGEAGRQREWYELTSLDYSKVSLSAPITWQGRAQRNWSKLQSELIRRTSTAAPRKQLK
jgi:hypothetical protein